MVKLNKRGGEKIISIWWFAILAVIAVAVVVAAGIFQTTEINLTQMESDILAKQVLNCVTDGGFVKPEVFSDNFNVFSSCGLDESVLDSERYQLSFEIYRIDSCSVKAPVSYGFYEKPVCTDPLKTVFKGTNLAVECEIQKKGVTFTSFNYNSGCYENYVYLSNSSNSGDRFVMHIFTGSKQNGKRMVSQNG